MMIDKEEDDDDDETFYCKKEIRLVTDDLVVLATK